VNRAQSLELVSLVSLMTMTQYAMRNAAVEMKIMLLST
jgi:hypothetical protein